MGEIVFTIVSFNFFTESVSCNDCQPLIERDVGRLSAIYPRSSDPFYIVSYYIKWVTTSWTHSKKFLSYCMHFVLTVFLLNVCYCV